MKIAAVGDIHVSIDKSAFYVELFKQIASEADVLVLCGDLTDLGTLEEAALLAEYLKVLSIPCVAVLGNHDYERDLQSDIVKVLRSDHVTVLDGESVVINGVGFAGTKGFIGGFDDHVLPFWGEPLIKSVVQEGINEALKLERALSTLETGKKVALLHYSPTKQTVLNESPEIYPFLGSSRLCNPLLQFGVNVAFHGHAHKGPHKMTTENGLSIFNVAKVLLEETIGKEYLLYEI